MPHNSPIMNPAASSLSARFLKQSAFTLALALLSGTTFAQSMKPFTYQEMLMLDRMNGLSVDPAGH
jgi:hypothetical protein